ncbi:MAG: Gfo/Idh/MocA family protein [Armatimonadota bacterium]
MSERPFRFAVLGLGMGMQHGKDLQDARGCELVAVCDRSPERLQTAREQYGVRATTDFDDLLRDPEIDVVNVCTPSGTHAELSIKALQAGKHVICEKPPDVTVAAVDAMIAAKRESGKQLMVIFQARFEPLYREWRQALQSGRFGTIAGVHGATNWWRAPSYYVCPGMWKGTWKLDGGGSLANQGIHTLDLLQWLAGPVVEVYGKFGCYAHDIESEDKTAAVLTFKNGAIGTLTTTTAAYPGLDRTIMIHGSKGSAVVTDDELVRWRALGETPDAEQQEEEQMLARFGKKGDRSVTTASDPFAFATRGHLMQFEEFAEAMATGAEPPNSIETTRHTVEIFTAVYESGRTGKPVRLGGD